MGHYQGDYEITSFSKDMKTQVKGNFTNIPPDELRGIVQNIQKALACDSGEQSDGMATV